MTMEYPKLYKRTATGAVQVWWQETDGDRYRSHSGQDGGAITSSEWTVAVPKNVGRANATTAEQQAEAEVASNYDLKRKRGYKDSVAEAEASDRFEPMLAQPYDKAEKHVAKLIKQGPVLVQPKLDGIRCIARAEGLFSRNGTPIVAVPHIHKALLPLFAVDPDLVLDGELYNHDLKHDFPKLVSLVRKTKPTDEDVREAEVMQYWVYDYPSWDDGFGARSTALTEMLANVEHVVTVDTIQVESHEDINRYFEDCLSAGYEGVMIRDPKSLYEQKRSKNLVKYKPEDDGEFEVVDIEEGIGNRAGMAGRVCIRLPNGETSHANPKGDRDTLTRMLATRDELIGKQATVVYNGLLPSGAPRFARVKHIHTESRW